jgi:hypothetical protein
LSRKKKKIDKEVVKKQAEEGIPRMPFVKQPASFYSGAGWHARVMSVAIYTIA